MYIIKNAVVKIISSTVMIRKFLGEMCILGVRGNLSQRNEYKIVIKMQIIPRIGLSNTKDIYAASFQDPYTVYFHSILIYVIHNVVLYTKF